MDDMDLTIFAQFWGCTNIWGPPNIDPQIVGSPYKKKPQEGTPTVNPPFSDYDTCSLSEAGMLVVSLIARRFRL